MAASLCEAVDADNGPRVIRPAPWQPRSVRGPHVAFNVKDLLPSAEHGQALGHGHRLTKDACDDLRRKFQRNR